MEIKEKLNNPTTKKIVGIILAVILIVGIVYGVRSHTEKARAEKRVEEARAELEKALQELHNTTPGLVSNADSNSNSNSIETGLTSDENTEDEIIEYINKYFVLEKAVVKKFESYSGKEWGLTEIQVKNKGKKVVKDFEITVFFKDKDGNDIAEDSFYIGESTIGNPLKPNYSWKQEKDRFYTFDHLTDEINPKRNTIKITDLEFE